MKGKVFLRCCFSKFSSYQERVRERRWYIKMADRKSCDQCPKTFASGSGLWTHKQTHSAVERYNCSQCNKSFSQAGNLKRHSLIHTGEKPHQCAQCNYSANQAVNPREHIKNHRGEKLKKCKQCDYTTTRSNSLKHHKRDPLWRKATQVHNLWVFQQLVNWMNDEEAHRRKPIQV